MTKVETIVGKYADGFVLNIPEEASCIFPPNGNRDKNTFPIMSNDNENWVWVSKRHSSGKLDHIHVTHTNWWKELTTMSKEGDMVVIQVTESKGVRRYRI